MTACLAPATLPDTVLASGEHISGLVYHHVDVTGACPDGSLPDMTATYVLIGTLCICWVLGFIAGGQR